MSIGAALGIGASLLGGRSQSRAARRAADAQERANNDNIAFQRETRDQIIERIKPFYQSGLNYQNALDFELLGGEVPMIDGQAYRGFQMSPGNVFRLQQAQEALEGSAAARGGLLSGATANALQENAIGMSNQFYDNYLNRLFAGASGGQSAAAGQANAASNAASNIGAAYNNIGNAQAAGAIAQGNATANALSNAFGVFNYHNQLGDFGGGQQGWFW